MFEAFQKGKRIKELGVAKKGIVTGDNEKFMRMYWEVNNQDLNNKWVVCAKGGAFRKYFGNLDRVIDWSKASQEFYKQNKSSSSLNKEHCFKKAITYTTVTSSGTGFRYLPDSCLFSNGGPSILNIENIEYIMGFLNSNITKHFLQFLNPTINLMLYNINEIPIIFDKSFENEIRIYVQVYIIEIFLTQKFLIIYFKHINFSLFYIF